MGDDLIDRYEAERAFRYKHDPEGLASTYSIVSWNLLDPDARFRLLSTLRKVPKNMDKEYMSYLSLPEVVGYLRELGASKSYIKRNFMKEVNEAGMGNLVDLETERYLFRRGDG